ncbi:MAG: cyclase family protein [Coriobacteriia bacterium]|nr:cyclase family protein [Coriobacteriia bacterium]
MRIYDVTVPLGPATPIWDDDPAPVIETLAHFDRGDAHTLTRIAMSSHSGTHVDAPAHFAPGGTTIDAIPAATLVGPALVVEHEGETHITAADLDALGVDGRYKRALFKTANGRLWERDGFQRDFIALDESAADRLIEYGIVLAGIDYLSIEPYDAPGNNVHRALLGAGVTVVEGLDLREVLPGEYLLVCAPLKLAGAEGAPARVFLLEGW